MGTNVKIAVIGAGYWGKNLVRNFSELKVLDAICDVDGEILKQYSDKNLNIKLLDSYTKVLDDKNITGVVIATPVVTHYELAKHAIIAGKHVFVEKPLTLSSAEAKELIEIAQKKKKILMVGHLLRYHPAVIKIKKMIDSGELGEIYYIYSQRVNLGKVRKDESVLWSLTVHDISVILYLLDKEPIAVSALGQCCLQDKIEDVAFLTLQFGDRKLAHIHVSWLDPHKIRKFTIVGNKKMVVFDDMKSSEKIKIYDKGVNIGNNFVSYQEFITLRDGDIHIPSLKMEEPLKLECENFINCIRNNTQPLADGYDGLRVVRVLEAAQKSISNNGAEVKL